jgi:Na+/H+ antiporter NhaD/arsenite permease-like protein
MIAVVVLIFLLGYIMIVLEHPLRLDKTVPALILGSLTWAFIALGDLPLVDHHDVPMSLNDSLLFHIGKIAEILLFLVGAMTIVEIIDLHKGFTVITQKIRTINKRKILLTVAILSFFLSAVLDNLAATIVIISLLRKLIRYRTERIWFVGIAVICANAGGAWSPIGDVTTTMLWIGKKVSTVGLFENLIIPSLVCMVVPVAIAYFLKPFKGNIHSTFLSKKEIAKQSAEQRILSSKKMLNIGLGGIIFVPIFKTLTGLPPYLGMMFSLSFVWLVSEYIKPEKDFSPDRRSLYSAPRALSKIEMPSILFFLGILLGVAALESLGLLQDVADFLNDQLPSQNLVVIFLGVFSSIFDNVPLVAASMGMYDDPLDSFLWHFIAYSAGTGGSLLIIGSAAGVTAMGMEKIDFIWYFKNVTLLALVGFLAGAVTFIIMHS